MLPLRVDPEAARTQKSGGARIAQYGIVPKLTCLATERTLFLERNVVSLVFGQPRCLKVTVSQVPQPTFWLSHSRWRAKPLRSRRAPKDRNSGSALSLRLKRQCSKRQDDVQYPHRLGAGQCTEHVSAGGLTDNRHHGWNGTPAILD